MTDTQKETGVTGFEIKVKNISWEAKQEDVEAFLRSFTSVEQVKLLVNRKTNRSKGYAYATLTDQAALDKALAHTNLDHMGRTLQVLQARPQGEKTQQQAEQQQQYQQKQTSLYVGNLTSNVTEQQVRDLFQGSGEVKNVKLVPLRKDESKVYGFVDFADNQSVQNALKLEGHILDGQEIQVKYKRQQQRNNRQGGQRRQNNNRGGERGQRGDRGDRGDGQRRQNNDRPRKQYDRDYDRNDNGQRRGDGQQRNERRNDRNQGQQRDQSQQDSSSIYIGNLDFHTDEQTLRDVFAGCGEIEEVRIVKNRDNGRSKGFGFINFNSAQAAKKALELSNEEVDGRQIKVDLQSSRQQQGGDRQRNNYQGDRPRNNYQNRDNDDGQRRGDGQRREYNNERRGDNNERRGGNRGGQRGERRGGNRGGRGGN